LVVETQLKEVLPSGANPTAPSGEFEVLQFPTQELANAASEDAKMAAQETAKPITVFVFVFISNLSWRKATIGISALTET